MAAKNLKADPMKTRTGKTRLGPLNIKQLYDLLEKESKPKNKGKIRNRIKVMEDRGFKLPEVVKEETVEGASE